MAGRVNGADAMFLLGSLNEAVKAVRHDIADIRVDVSEVKADVASLKANQRPRRRRTPPWMVVRFVLAAVFALSAATLKVEPRWVSAVLSLAR